jgi:hypothetical protein
MSFHRCTRNVIEKSSGSVGFNTLVYVIQFYEAGLVISLQGLLIERWKNNIADGIKTN